MKFTQSSEVIELIEKKKRNGIALRQFKAFMESIGNPQQQLQSIHIGGTNGKGSTLNNLRSVLQEAGYKVGSFTSPYLETHHDRIRINDVYISDERIVEYANKYYTSWMEYDLSMFEIDMFIATMYFVEEAVDYAIFEVGLGGAQDATNIVVPMVSVITNVGKDHMEFLGETYEEIASAKAGIIKDNVALITAERKEICTAIFKTKCKQKQANYISMQNVEDIVIDDCLQFRYRGIDYRQDTLARYQAQNAALAIEVLLYLNKTGKIQVNTQQIQNGIYKAKWKGRFEVLQKEPLILVDGAHNIEGMQALVDSMQEYDNINVLFSALKDKPYDAMLTILESISNRIYVCEFPFYRSEKASIIARNHNVTCIEDYKEALRFLIEKKEPLLICGSLYFISLVRDNILKGESTL